MKKADYLKRLKDLQQLHAEATDLWEVDTAKIELYEDFIKDIARGVNQHQARDISIAIVRELDLKRAQKPS